MFAGLSSNLQLKSEPGVMTSDVNSSAKLLIPGRVTAATNIPRGAESTPIDPKLLSGSHDIIQIMVGMNSRSNLELDSSSNEVWNSSVHWIRALRLSEDCHSYNVQLKLQMSDTDQKSNNLELILHATKPINAGQELVMWFSEQILAIVQMVFLTPANIQGQKKYVCTKCSMMYEFPNPLKLHITLGCGQQSISEFWNKLKKGLTDENSLNTKFLPEFTFKLTPSKQKSSFSSSQDLRTTNLTSQETTDVKILYRPYSEPPSIYSSAFKPFKKTDSDDKSKQSLSYENLQCWPNFVFAQNLYNHNSLLSRNKANTDDEAQIETLVSSLGKSKEGHICLYCGKCYSRKYGLKIHIRTHTGYKPLKCKYCLRAFGDPSNLNKHVRLHAEGDTPYRCDLCGKVLVRRRDLERHLKSRHMSEMNPGRSIIEEQSNQSNLMNEDNEDLNVDR